MCKFLRNKENFPLFVSFLIGIAIGFLISPVKKGVSVLSYNGSYNSASGKSPKSLDELDD